LCFLISTKLHLNMYQFTSNAEAEWMLADKRMAFRVNFILASRLLSTLNACTTKKILNYCTFVLMKPAGSRSECILKMFEVKRLHQITHVTPFASSFNTTRTYQDSFSVPKDMLRLCWLRRCPLSSHPHRRIFLMILKCTK
jgi:hypothetical protein